jgi:hypothetical protein
MPCAVAEAVRILLQGGPAPGRLLLHRFPSEASTLSHAGFTALEEPTPTPTYRAEGPSGPGRATVSPTPHTR